MTNRFQELRDKEVIHVCEGTRLGYVNDLVVDLCTGRVFNSHGFFHVVAGIPLIPVQRLFTVFRELPHQSVDNAAFPGCHRRKAAAACVSASASRIRRPMASMTLAVTLLPACLYACASDWMARMRSICP